MNTLYAWLGDETAGLDASLIKDSANLSLCLFCFGLRHKDDDGWSRSRQRRCAELFGAFICRQSAGDMSQPIRLMDAVFHHLLEQVKVAGSERVDDKSRPPNVVDRIRSRNGFG